MMRKLTCTGQWGSGFFFEMTGEAFSLTRTEGKKQERNRRNGFVSGIMDHGLSVLLQHQGVGGIHNSFPLFKHGESHLTSRLEKHYLLAIKITIR
jgi:hypothetical protein